MKCFNAIVSLVFMNCVYGSFFQFYPLTAKQVYDTLREIGREDAVPQGRLITQGLAAMTGFAAGIATGLGVPLVLNIDLANATGILGSSNQNNNNGGNNKMTVQEICFNSRSLDEINDDEEMERSLNKNIKWKHNKVHEGRELEENDEEEYLDYPTSTDVEAPEMANAATGTTNFLDSPQEVPTFQTRSTSVEYDDILTNSPTVTTKGYVLPGTQTNTNPILDDGEGTATNSITSTYTGTGGTVNCIVIQKPTKR